MDIKRLQSIDQWLGSALCFLFTILRFIFSRKVAYEKPQKVVFIKLVEKGSMIIAYSAFKRAVDRLGQENVYLITFEKNKDIASVLNVFREDNIITIKTSSLFISIRDILASMIRVRRDKIDALVDLEFFSKMTAAYSFLLGSSLRSGLHAFVGGPYRGNLFTHRALYSFDLHTRQTYETLFEVLYCDSTKLPSMDYRPTLKPKFLPEWHADDAIIESVKLNLFKEEILSNRVIIFNTYPSDELPSRRWPEAYYVSLGNRILERYSDSVIVLMGMKDDESENDDISKSIGESRCYNLSGKTTLEELMGLFELSDLLVSSDGGASHIASLTSIPVITLFGPESPRLFAAETDRNHVIYAGLACSPSLSVYTRRSCVLNEASSMKAIQVDEVFQKTIDILEG